MAQKDNNGNFIANSTDALEILKYVVKIENILDEVNFKDLFNPAAFAAADIFGDGKIGTQNALQILMFMVKMPSDIGDDKGNLTVLVCKCGARKPKA